MLPPFSPLITPILCGAALPGEAGLQAEARLFVTQALEAQKTAPDRPLDLESARSAFRTRLARETRPADRQALLTGLFLFALLEGRAPEATLVERLKQEVPSTSAAWSVDVNLLPRFLDSCFSSPREAEAFAAPGRERNPDAGVRAALLMAQFQANQGLRDDVAQDALCRLETEFPKDARTASALKEWEAAKRLPVGSQAPELDVPVLGQSGLRLRLDSFRGTPLLILFWASWCPNCRAEIPLLQRAWERHHREGLEILSLSVDSQESDIEAFRAQSGSPMPWHHGWLSESVRSRVLQAYGATGIPKLVLLDARGRVAAKDAALRGEALERAVAALLGNPASQEASRR